MRAESFGVSLCPYICGEDIATSFLSSLKKTWSHCEIVVPGGLAQNTYGGRGPFKAMGRSEFDQG